MTGQVDTRRNAVLSACGAYRYSLTREWDDALELLTFVMLNPSTADASNDDPTIRRCRGFAVRLGYGAIKVVNLFALRATDPTELRTAVDPVGPENDDYLRGALMDAAGHGVPIIAAWGALGAPERVAWLLGLIGSSSLRCLGYTRAGAPRHPLYLPGGAPLLPFPPGPHGVPAAGKGDTSKT